MLINRHTALRAKERLITGLLLSTLKILGGENCKTIAASLLRIAFINSIVGT